MLKKFAIEYSGFPHRNSGVLTQNTDDPVEAEEFLMQLLTERAHIIAIRHDGVDVTGHQFDQMIKVAAIRIIAAMLQDSLALDAPEIKSRFGFAA